MSELDSSKLHVTYLEGVRPDVFRLPRRYTLTHSDRTGDVFLTIGQDYNRKQVSGWYTRFMRDEVLAEWKQSETGVSLHVYCHVSGGFVLGTGRWREGIFRSEMRFALEALIQGDRALIDVDGQLDEAPIWIHFETSKAKNTKIEKWGTVSNYKI